MVIVLSYSLIYSTLVFNSADFTAVDSRPLIPPRPRRPATPDSHLTFELIGPKTPMIRILNPTPEPVGPTKTKPSINPNSPEKILS